MIWYAACATSTKTRLPLSIISLYLNTIYQQRRWQLSLVWMYGIDSASGVDWWSRRPSNIINQRLSRPPPCYCPVATMLLPFWWITILHCQMQGQQTVSICCIIIPRCNILGRYDGGGSSITVLLPYCVDICREAAYNRCSMAARQ